MRVLLVAAAVCIMSCGAAKPPVVAEAPKPKAAPPEEACPVLDIPNKTTAYMISAGAFRPGWKPDDSENAQQSGENLDVTFVNSFTNSHFRVQAGRTAAVKDLVAKTHELLLRQGDKVGDLETREIGCETLTGFPAVVARSDGKLVGSYVIAVATKRHPAISFLVMAVWPHTTSERSKVLATEAGAMAASLRLVKKQKK